MPTQVNWRIPSQPSDPLMQIGHRRQPVYELAHFILRPTNDSRKSQARPIYDGLSI